MCWLTPDTALNKDCMADLFLRSVIARVDYVFLKTRRLFNAFERPVGTSKAPQSLARLFAVQPGDAAEVPNHFPGNSQHRVHGQEERAVAMQMWFAE